MTVPTYMTKIGAGQRWPLFGPRGNSLSELAMIEKTVQRLRRQRRNLRRRQTSIDRRLTDFELEDLERFTAENGG